jgi:hypothetical protein
MTPVSRKVGRGQVPVVSQDIAMYYSEVAQVRDPLLAERVYCFLPGETEGNEKYFHK